MNDLQKQLDGFFIWFKELINKKMFINIFCVENTGDAEADHFLLNIPTSTGCLDKCVPATIYMVRREVVDEADLNVEWICKKGKEDSLKIVQINDKHIQLQCTYKDNVEKFMQWNREILRPWSRQVTAARRKAWVEKYGEYGERWNQ